MINEKSQSKLLHEETKASFCGYIVNKIQKLN